jgi:hypothetical protein
VKEDTQKAGRKEGRHRSKRRIEKNEENVIVE